MGIHVVKVDKLNHDKNHVVIHVVLQRKWNCSNIELNRKSNQIAKSVKSWLDGGLRQGILGTDVGVDRHQLAGYNTGSQTQVQTQVRKRPQRYIDTLAARQQSLRSCHRDSVVHRLAQLAQLIMSLNSCCWSIDDLLALPNRWTQITKVNEDHKDERRSQRWTQITKMNADQTVERRSNRWTQIKQMNADHKDERRSQRWTKITKLNADHNDERRSNRWTQIKQMNADQTVERRSQSWTQITKMNADHKDERRSNRWMQITKMNADQTDERRSNLA